MSACHVPGRASYTPGSDDKCMSAAIPMLVAHVRVRDGRIELDCRSWNGRRMRSTITLPGREFNKFGIAGSGNLVLDNLDQERAEGQHRRLGLHQGRRQGRGLPKSISPVRATPISARCSRRVAKVHIAGSGNTDIAPTDEADIHIAGSGDVNLHTNPKKLETHIAGSGRIHNIGSGG